MNPSDPLTDRQTEIRDRLVTVARERGFDDPIFGALTLAVKVIERYEPVRLEAIQGAGAGENNR